MNYQPNDIAYMWHPQVNHNSTGLLGSIVKVRIMEKTEDGYLVVILLAGRPTVIIAKGEVCAVTEDELFATTDALMISMQEQYQEYLAEQVQNLIKYKDREYDPGRVS